MLQVFVQGQALHTVDVSSETTVEALKEAVVPLEGISVEEQVLTYGGVPLENESLLVDCVQEMGTLNMTVRVVGGRYTRYPISFVYYANVLSDIREVCIYTNLSFCVGKVHGSLARAGKVRGQTPKVRRRRMPCCRSCSSHFPSCRLILRRRRRRRQAVQRDACSTTAGL